MKKWYNVELFNSSEIDSFRLFLKSTGIPYEASGVGSGIHFEVLLDSQTFPVAEKFLASL